MNIKCIHLLNKHQRKVKNMSQQLIESILTKFENSDQAEINISHCAVDKEFIVGLSLESNETATFSSENLIEALHELDTFVHTNY